VSAGILAKRGLLLAVTGVSLYLLAPALLEVFGAFDRLDDFNPLWYVAMIGLQVGSYACMWVVQKIAVRAERIRPVATSQLASNAFGRIVPGGVAAAGAMQYAMLVRAGVPAAAAASGMTASSVLVFGILLALPLLALPAILFGAPVDPGLGRAAVVGGVVFIAVFAGGAAAIVWDRPLVAVGRAAQSIRNRVRRRRPPLTGLPARLLRERNAVSEVLGKRWWEALLFAAGRWVLDYLTLLAALTAVHADPRASAVLLAFCAAQFLGTLPLTPGGLGFVEAGLTGTLALAGVPAGEAVVATLAYRLASFWLPIPAGGVAALLHRRYYGSDENALIEQPDRESENATEAAHATHRR
jgi:putative heme transporter